MAFFGYDVFGPPFLRYHELSPTADLVHSTDIEIPRATMMHDFAMSATRVAFLDLPVVFDLDLAMAGTKLPFAWKPEAGARIGIMARGAAGSTIRWIGFDPCYVFHIMNAFDDGPRFILDVCRYDTMFDTGEGGFISSTEPHLERWSVDLAAGRVTMTTLDDRHVEFPRIDDSLVGRRYRYGYCAEQVGARSDTFANLVRYDLSRDEATVHEFGEHVSVGEPVFVRAPDGRSDDEGWVLSVVYDASTELSDLVILDASSFTKEPEAVVHLPARVPYGFHGSWLPAERYR
jgi:carotenoid cleavage dioxygenase